MSRIVTPENNEFCSPAEMFYMLQNVHVSSPGMLDACFLEVFDEDLDVALISVPQSACDSQKVNELSAMKFLVSSLCPAVFDSHFPNIHKIGLIIVSRILSEAWVFQKNQLKLHWAFHWREGEGLEVDHWIQIQIPQLLAWANHLIFLIGEMVITML